MESLHKLESTVAGWLKDVPHLPTEVRKWIAENAWWIAIVGVVIGGFGILTLLGALAVVGGLAAVSVGVGVGAALAGTFLIASFVSLAALVINVVLEALAIKPLKSLSKRGWDLLFLAAVLNFGFSAVSALLRYDIIGVVFAALGAAVTSYFLFEVVAYFKPVGKEKVATKPVEK